ncbi:MAG: hypothetical protein FJX52_10660, partial [Alphaproteobacteria bacterium]|nr:hypothetical protein [Alphaproteobacteria bacterium]
MLNPLGAGAIGAALIGVGLASSGWIAAVGGAVWLAPIVALAACCAGAAVVGLGVMRRRLRLELAHQAERQAGLMRDLPLGLAEIAGDGTIVTANAAFVAALGRIGAALPGTALSVIAAPGAWSAGQAPQAGA